MVSCIEIECNNCLTPNHFNKNLIVSWHWGITSMPLSLSSSRAFSCLLMNLFKSGATVRGEGGREMLIELLRSWQLPWRREKSYFIGEAEWGEGGQYWPGLPQLSVLKSQWKFIFPIRHISFRIRLDSMLKLIRNYINPNRLTVQTTPRTFRSVDKVTRINTDTEDTKK